MDYNESHVQATLKVSSANKTRMEELILEMRRIGGIDELSANALLCSAALMQE